MHADLAHPSGMLLGQFERPLPGPSSDPVDRTTQWLHADEPDLETALPGEIHEEEPDHERQDPLPRSEEHDETSDHENDSEEVFENQLVKSSVDQFYLEIFTMVKIFMGYFHL